MHVRIVQRHKIETDFLVNDKKKEEQVLIKTYDLFLNTVYSFTALLGQTDIQYRRIEVKRLNAAAVHARRKEYEKLFSIPLNTLRPKEQAEAFGRRRHKYVKFLAYKGALTGCGLSRQELEEAKKGFVPKGYDVHHIIPLSLGGTNHISNLVLIPRKLHEKIHQYMFDALYKKLPECAEFKPAPEGEKTYVFVPIFPRAMERQYKWVVAQPSAVVAKPVARKMDEENHPWKVWIDTGHHVGEKVFQKYLNAYFLRQRT